MSTSRSVRYETIWHLVSSCRLRYVRRTARPRSKFPVFDERTRDESVWRASRTPRRLPSSVPKTVTVRVDCCRGRAGGREGHGRRGIRVDDDDAYPTVISSTDTIITGAGYRISIIRHGGRAVVGNADEHFHGIRG